MALGPAIELEAITQALLMNSEDFEEFYRAWSEGRQAEWSGPVSEPHQRRRSSPPPVGFSHARQGRRHRLPRRPDGQAPTGR